MSWITPLAIIALAASAAMFGIAAVSHLRNRDHVPGLIAADGVIPRRSIRAVAVLLVVSEAMALVLLLGDTIRITFGRPAQWLIAPLVLGFALALYAGVAWRLASRQSKTVDCGCGGPAEAPLGPLTALRAGVLVLFLGFAAVHIADGGSPGLDLGGRSLALSMGALLGVGVFLLPASLSIPNGGSM